MAGIPKARLESVFSSTSRSRQVQNFHPSYLDNLNFMAGFEIEDSQDIGLNLFTENPIGSGIVNRIVEGTIGTGLKLESSVCRELLGDDVTDEVITRFQDKVEAYWNRFASKPEMCDWYGEHTMGELEAICLIMGLFGGDCLRHIAIADVGGKLYLPRIQLISGRHVSSPNHSDSGNVVAGVERDRKGKDIAYHVEVIKDDEASATSWVRREKYSKNGRIQFKLIKFGEVESGLVRGRSIFNSVKELIIQAGRFTEAEVTKAIIQACITLFIESEKDNIEDPEDSGIDAIADSQVQDPDVTTPDEDEDPDTPITLSPGAAYKLPPGQKAHLAEATAPVAQFMMFMEMLLKIISLSVGIPYEVLIECFNSNYSASQAAIQAAARSWSIWRMRVVARFLTDIYSQFVECLVRQGKVVAPGYLDGDPFVRLAWESAVWHGPATIHIDPVKAVEASGKAVNYGFSTRETEAMKLYENDFWSNVKRLGDEKKALEKNGLVVSEEKSSADGEKKDNEEDKDAEE